ncbi:MAG TPA: hypothetical protein VMM79_05950 [Longimicrobiales bacterium]|nr:hypothetical protein [Longimicrobiales bacterium]
MIRPGRVVLIATGALVLSSVQVAAQAVCAAPHSSPNLSRAGIGILPPAAGWIQFTGYHGQSSDFFGPDGNSRPFLSEGSTSTSSMFITAAGGVVRGLEVWVQVPVHRIGFSDETGSLSRIGIGDPRLSARIGGDFFGLQGLPLSLRAGLKLPGSDFPVDPDVLPISEGQTDIEIVAEAGRVLAGSYPLHIVGWAGYRWRMRNDERARKPGDERFGRIGLGGPLGSLRWDLAVEGLWGLAPEQQGFTIDGARRRLVQVLPTVGWRVGAAELEITGRFSVSGRNLPSGPSVSAGFLLPWII